MLFKKLSVMGATDCARLQAGLLGRGAEREDTKAGLPAKQYQVFIQVRRGSLLPRFQVVHAFCCEVLQHVENIFESQVATLENWEGVKKMECMHFVVKCCSMSKIFLRAKLQLWKTGI